jgi:uncharacterized glyoxalase superfamily protein PhnB
MTEASRIYPSFRYRNAPAMIDWLVEAFGFKVHAKYMDGDLVAHAQLSFGSAIIMLGSVRSDEFGHFVGAPGERGGKATYLVVDDTDAAFAQAKAAGARVLEEPADRDYGSRECLLADPEGNLWALGTYWPKAGEPAG